MRKGTTEFVPENYQVEISHNSVAVLVVWIDGQLHIDVYEATEGKPTVICVNDEEVYSQ